MRKLFLLFCSVLTLFAFDIAKLVQLYQQKEYKKVCDRGFRNFNKIRQNEDLILMYAFSCLYSDHINRLYVPTMLLGKTKEGRHNRTYFSMIIAQKNLLISALFDKETFHDLFVPYTDYVLSRVFNLFFQKKYTKKDEVYIMHDEIASYRLYIDVIKNKRWLVIEEIRNGTKTIHKYR